MSMNVDFKGVEIGGLASVTSGVTFVAGRAVIMGSTGVTVPSASARAIGLIKEHLISGVLDEINGQFGIYGALKATVLAMGVATVQQSVLNGVSYAVYDQTQTYTLGNVIQTQVTGSNPLLTNQEQGGGSSGMVLNGLTSCRIGLVLKVPNNPANGDPMQISVNCAN
jgi:hypothetical protein